MNFEQKKLILTIIVAIARIGICGYIVYALFGLQLIPSITVTILVLFVEMCITNILAVFKMLPEEWEE